MLQKSLAAIAPRSTRESLARLATPTSRPRWPTWGNRDPDQRRSRRRTHRHLLHGTATSDGQRFRLLRPTRAAV